MLKHRNFILFNFVIILFCLAPLLEAKEKPLETMNRIRSFSMQILEESLQSDNAFIRSAAARAAGESEYSGLIPLLKKAAGDPYHTTRLFALQGIKKISIKEARAMALSLSKDLNVWVRGAAIEMLGDLGDGASGNFIRPHLKSPDRAVRYAAAGALFRLGDESELDVLLDGLKGGNSIDRYQAIGYLGKMGDERVVPYLKKLLSASEDEIIFYSLKAIGKKADKNILPQLLDLAEHHNPSLNHHQYLTLLY